MAVKQKVYAYITHRRKPLVFRHPDSPEAGIQVLGGTVGVGEVPAVAVLHERFGSGGDAEPIAFDIVWVDLPDCVSDLIADQGAFIPQLLDILDD